MVEKLAASYCPHAALQWWGAPEWLPVALSGRDVALTGGLARGVLIAEPRVKLQMGMGRAQRMGRMQMWLDVDG